MSGPNPVSSVSPAAVRPGAARRVATLQWLGRPLKADDPAVAREAAAELTAQLFFAPLLAEMRKLPFGRDFASGGRGEEVFGEQLDLRIADAVARRDNGLTAQVAERLRSGSQAVTRRHLATQRAVWDYRQKTTGQNLEVAS